MNFVCFERISGSLIKESTVEQLNKTVHESLVSVSRLITFKRAETPTSRFVCPPRTRDAFHCAGHSVSCYAKLFYTIEKERIIFKQKSTAGPPLKSREKFDDTDFEFVGIFGRDLQTAKQLVH